MKRSPPPPHHHHHHNHQNSSSSLFSYHNHGHLNNQNHHHPPHYSHIIIHLHLLFTIALLTIIILFIVVVFVIVIVISLIITNTDIVIFTPASYGLPLLFLSPPLPSHLRHYNCRVNRRMIYFPKMRYFLLFGSRLMHVLFLDTKFALFCVQRQVKFSTGF